MKQELILSVVGFASAAFALYALATKQPSLQQYLTQQSTDDAAFAQYMAKYGKSYVTSEDYTQRREIFAAKMQKIAEHNAQNSVTWRMVVNQFTDMTPEEIRAKYTGGGVIDVENPSTPKALASPMLEAPTPVDWTAQMNTPRNQGSCGSCYAFATVAVLEGRYAIQYGSKESFSEQQIVDCNVDCYGCSGGWISYSFEYLQWNHVMTASQYPYTGELGTCNHDYNLGRDLVSGYAGVSDPKTDLASGPIGVYVNAVGDFSSYGGGIFNGYCGQYDHAVAAVGWGSENGIEYYIIRNSWGSTWGESGYIRIQIGGQCLLTFDSYPILK